MLDPEAKVLFRDGEPVALGRKAVETLLVLVENSGQVVTKDTIMRTVWADRVVDEANLTQNIAVLRKTLAAGPGDAAQIETFSGRGYRIHGPVERTQGKPAHTPAAAETVSRKPSEMGAVVWVVIAGAAAAAAGFLWYSRTPAAPVEQTVTPLTRIPGREYQPAITPDGSAVAFVFVPPGSGLTEIRVKERSGGDPRRAGAGDGHFSSPAWSPDGRSLAFLRTTRSATEVVTSAREGGAERLLARLSPPVYGLDFRLLEWSPDGTYLVVSHAPRVDRPAALFAIQLSTSEVTQLTEPAEGAAADVDPRFSPDGRTLSFLRVTHRARQELHTLNLQSKTTRALVRDSRPISSHDWTQDGRSIVYASNPTGDFRLWRIAMDGSGERESAGVSGEFPLQFATARHSGEAVYTRLPQDRNIWSLDLGKKTWTRLIASTGLDASPQYSPDGKWIAFRSDRSGEEQLWVSRADGTDAVEVTRSPLRPSVGRWSPDSEAIVFNDPQTSDIAIARLGAGGQWIVERTAHRGVHPVFAPDGRWLFAGGPKGISRTAAGGGETALLSTVKSESLAVSGDGRSIYFVKEPYDTMLQRLDVESGQLEAVLDGLVPGCSSCWALAPGGIYYLTPSPKAFDAQALRYFDWKTRTERIVAALPEPLWPVGSGPFSLSPDGRSLLVVRSEPTESDVMLIRPFR